MNIFWFLSSSMTVNWISLGCGQNETFEGFEKHWSTCFTIFWHFIDKRTHGKNNQQIEQTMKIRVSCSPTFYTHKNRAATLTVLSLISEVLPSTARGISDSQVTDGAATETDDSGRWWWRWRDREEKDGCGILYHHCDGLRSKAECRRTTW